MLKIYVVLSIIYAIRGMILTKETTPIMIGGEFIRNFLLFPYLALKDIKKWVFDK